MMEMSHLNGNTSVSIPMIFFLILPGTGIHTAFLIPSSLHFQISKAKDHCAQEQRNDPSSSNSGTLTPVSK